MASTRSLKLLRSGGGYYEGPRWHGERWWISDFHRTALFTITEEGVETLVESIPSQSSGIGWLPDGSLLIVSMKDHRLLRRSETGVLETYADLRSFGRSELNDMVVSASGHAYIGQFGFDINAYAKPEKTILIRVGPDRQAQVVADELFFPNGMVITPDGKTLIAQPHLRFDAEDMWTLDHVRGHQLGSPLRGFRALSPAECEVAVADYRKGFKINPCN